MEASELRYKDILDAARVLNRLQERARSNAQSPHRQSVRRTCENRAPGRRRPRTRASSSPGPWQSGAVLEKAPWSEAKRQASPGEVLGDNLQGPGPEKPHPTGVDQRTMEKSPTGSRRGV